MGSIGVGFGFGVGEGPSTTVGFGFGKPFKGELAGEGAACAFTTASSCLFFTSSAAFFSCCFCKKKTQPRPRKMTKKMIFLITKTRGTSFGQLRQRAFLSRTVFYSNHMRLVVHQTQSALDRAVFAKYANLSRTKFRAVLGIIDRTLLSVSAGSVRLNARPFKTLPAPSIWPIAMIV